MDQLKELLRQAIRYRFWIAVGISALLPMIAYAVGSGPIKTKAASETAAIIEAEKGVKQYSSGVIPNDQYRPLVDKEKEELSKDVNESWKKLYARQAPLLTWPATVEERFRTWGNKWPENVDASAVRFAIIDYVTAYNKQVEDVYKTFSPFNPVDGTGVVAAPPESVLLKPAPFTTENADLPSLGKVWAAQERLWIQRTLLQVVAEVNQGATNWDTAKIKQINMIDVGTHTAQDQISIAGGQTLEEAPALDPAGAAPAAAAAPAEGGAAGGEAPGMTPGMAMGAMGGMGGPQDADKVFYIKTESPQCKVLPFEISVLITQDNVQDLLVALENSPMAIQVSEFSMAKPAQRVTKPERGASMGEYGGMMGPGMGMGMGMGMGRGMTAFGPGMDMGMMMMPGGGYNMGGFSPADRKGTDVRSVDRAKKIQEERERFKKSGGATFNDPYYNVVEVTIYGQARFYNPPPPDAAPEPSQSADTAAPAAEAKAEGETPKAEPAKTEGETPKAEPAKTEGETPKAETPKAETPKAEPAKEEGTPKTEGEAPKAKDEAPAEKSEPAKDEPAAAPKSR